MHKDITISARIVNVAKWIGAACITANYSKSSFLEGIVSPSVIIYIRGKIDRINAASGGALFKRAHKAGLTPHVPKPQRGAAVANGFFRKDEFRYDAAQDAYVCPGRHELKPIRQGRLRDMRKVDYANARGVPRLPLAPAMHEQLPRGLPP